MKKPILENENLMSEYNYAKPCLTNLPKELEEKINENVKATMAMSGLYLTEEDVAMLRAYKGDGNENDQKIIEEIVKKYMNV